MIYYLIGSKLLGLENCKDTDMLVISTEHDYYREIKDDNIEILHRSEANILKFLNFEETNIYKYAQGLISNFQYDQAIIGQNFPIKYNILDHKEKLIELLDFIIEKKIFNFNPRITVNGGCCSKFIYSVAYNIFILQNNNPIITKSQREIIQKLHDGKMPISYINELKNIFRKIKKEVKENEKNITEISD